MRVVLLWPFRVMDDATSGCINPGARHTSLCAALVLVLASASWAQAPVRERISFNQDWRFAKGDPNGTADKLSYNTVRDWVLVTGVSFAKDPNFAHRKRPAANLGADVAYTQPGFDDKGWRSLTLPHDWGIEGPFDPKAPGGTGKLPFFGIGWYRKHFTVPADDQDRRLYLDVDGAMSYANVWLNGQYVGGWPYGYASWRVDLTPYVKFGGENVIAIRLDNPPNSSRWYPGGGIYRNVWLIKTAPVHIGHWGTCLTTPAPELLDLADKMGFLVMDEAFDVWVRPKTPLDFHLIFPDWGEQDLRALVRRDRNCPSVILWSIGNEVGEQFTGDRGAAWAKKLSDIVQWPTRKARSGLRM